MSLRSCPSRILSSILCTAGVPVLMAKACCYWHHATCSCLSFARCPYHDVRCIIKDQCAPRQSKVCITIDVGLGGCCSCTCASHDPWARKNNQERLDFHKSAR
ncbi:uncharacterized protein B0I36DRAFT_144005 [Microdochium trichocladiopsis]|uniref:Secreted protein n=1 Tax=Microdochium trichocladiopsis TaxID=1682393 RepID=A0A9P8Y270_9PEZI|nr:uncharacterized protein B0I36DRAFT_144005 [Microdochium trichocladiopsis]KAH7027825.1 hypothetical protein B0I36DRAFT_144005 [Microdochium trichocladiopsis]